MPYTSTSKVSLNSYLFSFIEYALSKNSSDNVISKACATALMFLNDGLRFPFNPTKISPVNTRSECQFLLR